MTTFEIALSLGSIITAVVGAAYVERVVKTSGRSRPHDPEGVQRMIDTAPIHLLYEVSKK